MFKELRILQRSFDCGETIAKITLEFGFTESVVLTEIDVGCTFLIFYSNPVFSFNGISNVFFSTNSEKIMGSLSLFS